MCFYFSNKLSRFLIENSWENYIFQSSRTWWENPNLFMISASRHKAFHARTLALLSRFPVRRSSVLDSCWLSNNKPAYLETVSCWRWTVIFGSLKSWAWSLESPFVRLWTDRWWFPTPTILVEYRSLCIWFRYKIPVRARCYEEPLQCNRFSIPVYAVAFQQVAVHWRTQELGRTRCCPMAVRQCSRWSGFLDRWEVGPESSG